MALKELKSSADNLRCTHCTLYYSKGACLFVLMTSCRQKHLKERQNPERKNKKRKEKKSSSSRMTGGTCIAPISNLSATEKLAILSTVEDANVSDLSQIIIDPIKFALNIYFT